MEKKLKAMSQEQASEYINQLVTIDKQFDDHAEETMHSKLKQALESRDSIEKKMKELQEQLEQGKQLLLKATGEIEVLGNILIECEDERRFEQQQKPQPTMCELQAVKDKE